MKSTLRNLVRRGLIGPQRTAPSRLPPSHNCALLSIDASRSVRSNSSSSSYKTVERKPEEHFETTSVGEGKSVLENAGSEELTSSTTIREHEVEKKKNKDATLAQELKEAVANERSKPPPSIVDQILAMLGIKTGTPFTYSTAKSLLDNCIVSSKKYYWFDDSMGRVGKDFRSKHTLLLIYVWMIHKRLLKMGEKGQDIQVTTSPTLPLRSTLSFSHITCTLFYI